MKQCSKLNYMLVILSLLTLIGCKGASSGAESSSQGGNDSAGPEIEVEDFTLSFNGPDFYQSNGGSPVKFSTTKTGTGVLSHTHLTLSEVGTATCSSVVVADGESASPTITLRGCSGDGRIKLSYKNSSSQSILIDNTEDISISQPNSLVLNSDRSIAYIVDSVHQAVYSINMSTGIKSIVSSSSLSIGSGIAITDPLAMAIDSSDSNLYIVATGGTKAVFSVNIANGNRNVVSNGSTGSGDAFIAPRSVAVNSTDDALYVTDGSRDAIFIVDISNGNRSKISENSNGSSIEFANPDYVVVNAANDTAYVIDSFINKYILSVNLSTGIRTIVSDSVSVGTGDALSSPKYLKLDETADLLYYLDTNNSKVMSVNIANGNRTEVSSIEDGLGPEISSLGGFEIDFEDSIAYYVDNLDDFVGEVDLLSEKRQLISGSFKSYGEKFNGTQGAFLGSDGFLYVTNSTTKSILKVDTTTGVRLTVSGDSVGSGTAFLAPSAITLNGDASKAYVTDTTLDALVEVNLSNGNRSIISDGSIGSGPAISLPYGVALNASGTTAYVVEGTYLSNSLIKINIADGVRTIVSDGSTGSGTNISNPRGVLVNAAETKAYIINMSPSSLQEVDLSDGNRIQIADGSTGSGATFNSPSGLSFSNDESKIYVVSGGNSDSVIDINLSTLVRTVVTAPSTGTGHVFSSPHTISINVDGTKGYVVDQIDRSLVEINISTGDRTLIAK